MFSGHCSLDDVASRLSHTPLISVHSWFRLPNLGGFFYPTRTPVRLFIHHFRSLPVYHTVVSVRMVSSRRRPPMVVSKRRSIVIMYCVIMKFFWNNILPTLLTFSRIYSVLLHPQFKPLYGSGLNAFEHVLCYILRCV